MILALFFANWRAMVEAVAVAAAFFFGMHVDSLSWQAAIDRQKAEASRQLAVAQANVAVAEAKAHDLNDRLELDHAAHAETIAHAFEENRALAARLAAGRVQQSRRGDGRDRPVPGSAQTPAINPGTAAGIVLSGQAAVDLVVLARDADAVAEYARTCHAWAVREP
jgi:Bacteriophage Rz lysis protein